MPNVRILAPELVELALNVPWKITIQFVVVLQDTLAILLIGVCWTRSPRLNLIHAILHLVDPTLCVLYWMEEQSANA